MSRMSVFYPNVYGSQNSRIEIFNNNSNVRSHSFIFKEYKLYIIVWQNNLEMFAMNKPTSVSPKRSDVHTAGRLQQ